ncbi:MAG: energy transducer TonB [Bacteroidetes bacterium]|nr:energy transducer TonB [Bacteroidota bacterium]MDA1120233.1 energy transducer TonB [Bacteroidota bacterium]
MSRSKNPKDFLQLPQYRGGKPALLEFIKSNLKYPQEALDNKIQGAVDLEYQVNGMGKIKEVKVIKGIGYGCDEEAVRLIGMLIYEKSYNKGINTITKKKISVHFKLPAANQLKVNYQITKKKAIEVKPKTATYSYWISVKKDNGD